MPEEDKEGRPVHPRPTGALPFRDEWRIPARLAIAGGCIALAVGFVLGVALVSGKGAAAQLSGPPEGVDFDPQAAQKVAERYSIETHVGDLVSCALPAASFDVVTMSQAVEHLFDPRGNLEECLRILKPGGLLVMTTPNVASRGAALFGVFWRGWEPPRHLHLFSVASLRQLTAQSGFEVVEARTYSAGAAVVYRVSRSNQLAYDGETANPLALLLWSYRQELREYRNQQSARDTGQNVLIRARKPMQGAS